jgi:hypothetical protein
LPGDLITEIAADAPMMIGEFKGSPDGTYVVVVNLSLEKSAKFKLKTVRPFKTIDVVSAEDGSPAPLDNEEGVWPVAGQGVLIRLGD